MIQALVPLLVTKLIEYGVDKISDKDDAEFVASTAKDIFGVVLDMDKPAAENAKLLQPYITKELDNLSELAMAKLNETVDGLSEEVATKTLLASYGTFTPAARVIVWLMVVAYLAMVGVFTYEYLTVFPEMPMSDVMLFTVGSLGGLVAVAVLPVRAVAYLATSIGSKLAARKVSTVTQKPTVTEIKVDSKTIKRIEK